MAVPHNTMSTHLAILTRAGLITPERSRADRSFIAPGLTPCESLPVTSFGIAAADVPRSAPL